MPAAVSIAILDDHSITIDGYRARLAQDSALHILWTTPYGEDVAVRMDQQPVDVLILDVSVPTSASNPNPYPILDVVPRLLERHPALTILVISMHMESRLIKTVLRLGASGYVLKDDREALNRLDQVVRAAVAGWRDQADDEPYFWDRLAYHLTEARLGEELAQTAVDFLYLARKCQLRSAFAAEADLAAAAKATPASRAVEALHRRYAQSFGWLNRAAQTPEVQATDLAGLLHIQTVHVPELAEARQALERNATRSFIGG